MLLDQVVERPHGKFYWTCHSTMELQCHIMISRGRSSRAMTPPILARIIKSHFQFRRLDPNVCSPALVFRYWKFNNHTATTEVETEHFGGDLRAPPAEVTTFELFCTFNSIICHFCERWMSLFPCGSQTPNPVWKWQASCQNHHPAHDGSPRSGQQGFKHWQIKTAWKKIKFFSGGETFRERELWKPFPPYSWQNDALLWIYISLSVPVWLRAATAENHRFFSTRQCPWCVSLALLFTFQGDQEALTLHTEQTFNRCQTNCKTANDRDLMGAKS